MKSNFLKRHFTKIEGPAPGPSPPLSSPPPIPYSYLFFFFFSFFLFFSFSFLSSCCISLVPAFSSKLDMCPLHSSIFTSNRPRYLWLGWASSWEMRTWAIPTSTTTHMPVSKGGSLMNTCFSQNNYVSWKILVLLLFCPFFPFSLEHGEAKGFFSLSQVLDDCRQWIMNRIFLLFF